MDGSYEVIAFYVLAAMTLVSLALRAGAIVAEQSANRIDSIPVRWDK